jgi:hypothetical protein
MVRGIILSLVFNRMTDIGTLAAAALLSRGKKKEGKIEKEEKKRKIEGTADRDSFLSTNLLFSI